MRRPAVWRRPLPPPGAGGAGLRKPALARIRGPARGVGCETWRTARAVAVRHRIVVVGASAGGVEALIGFVRGLPATLSCPVSSCSTSRPTGPSVLPTHPRPRATELTVVAAADRDELRPGHVYVAVPDHHLLVEDGHVRLPRSGHRPQTAHRPALDPALRRRPGRACCASSGWARHAARTPTKRRTACRARAALDVDVAHAADRLAPACRRRSAGRPRRPGPARTWIPAGRPRATEAELQLSELSRCRGRRGRRRRGAATSAEGNGTRFTCPDCGGPSSSRRARCCASAAASATTSKPGARGAARSACSRTGRPARRPPTGRGRARPLSPDLRRAGPRGLAALPHRPRRDRPRGPGPP